MNYCENKICCFIFVRWRKNMQMWDPFNANKYCFNFVEHILHFLKSIIMLIII